MKAKLYLFILILNILTNCGQREAFTIEELPNSSWEIEYHGIDEKRSVIRFPKDSTFTPWITQYWPLIISHGDLSFSERYFEFTTNEYEIKGDWGAITKDSIWMIGHEHIFPDTIYANFKMNDGLILMTISEAQVINMRIEDEIELFGGENIILELKD